MPILNMQLPIIPAVIAMDTENNRVAINKASGRETFVDSIESLPLATWKDKCLDFDGKEYPYNTWFSLENTPLLRDYFSKLIRHAEEHMQRNPFNF